MSNMPLEEKTSWDDARRLEAFAGEARVNRVRVAAIIVFYARHMVDMYIQRGNAALQPYHTRVTLIVLAWSLFSAYLHWMLVRRQVAPALKYAAVIWDLAMVTLLAMAAGVNGGPRSPLLLLYFVIIASASLRLDLPLVWTATLGAMAAYCLVLMHYAWWLVGWNRYYSPDGATLRIPRSTEGIFLLALGTAGLMAGQVVRQARRLVAGYPVTVASEKEGA